MRSILQPNSRAQPLVHSLEERAPVADVFEHLDRDHALEALVGVEPIHVRRDHVYVHEVPAPGLPKDELVARARASDRVQAHLNGKEPKVFVVPDKLVNFVV